MPESTAFALTGACEDQGSAGAAEAKDPEYASERISEDFMAATGRRSPKGWRTSCLEVAESKSHLKCAEVPMIA